MIGKFGNSRKGFYTAIIGTLAIFLVAVSLFNTMNYIETEKTAGYTNSMEEVKSRWVETRFVLDKTVSDAMADKAANGCSASGNYSGTIQAYFNEVINNQLSFGGIECTAGVPETVTNSLEFEVSLACASEIKTSGGVEFSASYEKSFPVHKTVTAQMSGGECGVTVRDNQSGIYEVG